MKKYKIKRKNLKEFFGFFGLKKKPEEIQQIIDNDPVLKKLEKELIAINTKAQSSLEKRVPPERLEKYRKMGWIK